MPTAVGEHGHPYLQKHLTGRIALAEIKVKRFQAEK